MLCLPQYQWQIGERRAHADLGARLATYGQRTTLWITQAGLLEGDRRLSVCLRPEPSVRQVARALAAEQGADGVPTAVDVLFGLCDLGEQVNLLLRHLENPPTD